MYAMTQNPFETSGLPTASERQLSFITKLRAERAMVQEDVTGLNIREASELIDELLNTPKPVRPAVETAPADELKPGAYRVLDMIYRVYKARGGSHMLAAMWDGETFEYAGLARRFVQPEHRLSLDEAKAFGAEFGVCCECGRLLTVPESVAAGIGPVCAGKF
jgi:hypothetical protein